jgi:hypothetical protein
MDKRELVSGKSLITVLSYPKDTVITVSGLYKDSCKPDTRVKRGMIKECSFKSLRRAKLIVRNVMEKMSQYVVLTYPDNYPLYGRVVARHRHAFDEWLRRKGVKYFWFLEFQKRGAAHINYLLTKIVNKGEMQRAWYRIVGSGDPLHLYLGVYAEEPRDKNKLSTYIAGYFTSKDARKVAQRQVPEGYNHVGRFWGVSRGLIEVEMVKVLNGQHVDNMRALRTARRLYTANCRAWGFKWRHRGKGWTMWGAGREMMQNQVMP